MIGYKEHPEEAFSSKKQSSVSPTNASWNSETLSRKDGPSKVENCFMVLGFILLGNKEMDSSCLLLVHSSKVCVRVGLIETH